MKKSIKYLIIVIVAVLLDQVLKYLVIDNLKVYQSFPLIKNFLYITLVYNTGAAFSMFNKMTFLIAVVSIVVLICLVRNMNKEKSHNFTKSMLCAGIAANLIDRAFRQSVVDFIHIYIFKYSFPVFNFADIYIVISIIVLIIYNVKEDLCKK